MSCCTLRMKKFLRKLQVPPSQEPILSLRNRQSPGIGFHASPVQIPKLMCEEAASSKRDDSLRVGETPGADCAADLSGPASTLRTKLGNICTLACNNTTASLLLELELEELEELVPIFPQPRSDGAFTCLAMRNMRTHTSVLVTPPAGRLPKLCHFHGRIASADVCEAVGCCPGPITCNMAPWHSDLDELFQGMHLVIGLSEVQSCHSIPFPIQLHYLLDQEFVDGASRAKKVLSAADAATKACWVLTANVAACEHFFEKGLCSMSTIDNVQACRSGAKTLHVFTDGSASTAGPQQRLGSAFTVWHGRDDHEFMQGCFAHSLGCVEDHGNDGPFIAECHALRLAVCWVLSQSTRIPVIIHYDSMRAGHAASGDWNTSGASVFARTVCRSMRALVLLLMETHDVTFRHVRAHSGCVPNMIADAFAKASAYGRISFNLPAPVSDLLHSPDVEWLWMCAHPPVGFPALEAALGRKVKAPCPSTVSEMADGVAHVGAVQERQIACADVAMRCVSYNVQSALDGKARNGTHHTNYGARLQLMFETFDMHGWDFVGLQDTHLGGDTLRSTARFICAQSPPPKVN